MNNSIVFISSTGGHWSQLKEIDKKINFKDLKKEVFFITEKNDTNQEESGIFFLKQQDRKNKFFIKMFFDNLFLSIKYYFKTKPAVVVSTGAGVVIPFLVISKLFGSKIIFIESYAKVRTPTITGRIVYKFADVFYIQWPELKRIYKNSRYVGKVY